jgi:hypothetical protein
MANVFRSKEVYKNFRYDIDKTKKVVAVQGVYVASEYRPPYYNEPGIHIYEISGQHCNVADFKTEEVDTSSTETAGMYKFELSQTIYNIRRYSSESKDISATETSGMYKFGMTATSYNIDRYEKDFIDASTTETAGMYKFGTYFAGYVKTRNLTQRTGSTPEPILRLSSLTSENCVITNYTS